MIEIKNLTKHYGSTVAVKNISLSVKKGEVLGFLGPNGAGKTTTMKILTCFMPPTNGTATVGGYDVLENPYEVRRKIGYLPENTPLYSDMVVDDYLYFITEMRKIPRSDRRRRINEMIEICSLKGVLKKDIGTLSKGFRQRVGLAQSMIHDPEILIMDEPTSGLDPSQIIEIRQLIKQLGKEKTIILCTHILPEVSATCDRVIIINDGEIAASGTPAELQNEVAGDTILYTTINAPKKDIEQTIKGINFVKELRLLDTVKSGTFRYRVVANKNDSDIGEAVFKAAVDKGWTLSELHKETMSLEDIFIRLTSEK